MNDNELKVSKAFSKQSVIFDEIYTKSHAAEHLREIYRNQVNSLIKTEAQILELNCGTGIDAIYFANRGHNILATDISKGMISQLNNKLKSASQLTDKIKPMVCSYHDLEKLKGKKFDYILSNFGGLNCTDRLDEVLNLLPALLNENGNVTLSIMPKVCPWEIGMMFKGKFRTAFRRFKNATPAHIEGEHFLCYYYNPAYILNVLKNDFKLISLKGAFIFVPPEFYANFVERYPKLYVVLKKIDNAIRGYYPFNRIGDYFVITLQKK